LSFGLRRAHHDRLQLLARAREAILVAAGAVARAALDQVRVLQRLEALRQQAARHQRHAVQDLAEAIVAAQELSDDEQRPALAHDLQRLRHRAELTICAHTARMPEGRARPQRRSPAVHFSNLRVPRPET